jgi:hypothetical protein
VRGVTTTALPVAPVGTASPAAGDEIASQGGLVETAARGASV